MAVRTLRYDIGVLALRREIQFTHTQATTEPLAAAWVPVFKALLDDCQSILLQEIALLDTIAQADAAAFKADRGCDAFAGKVSACVNDNTDGATRKKLRGALFDGKPLSRFRRPVLKGQLQSMTTWSATLASCGVAPLVALAPEAGVVVAAGLAAEAQARDAAHQNRTFRDVGARKQLIDKVNAVRREAYGALGKVPFENPAVPGDFADWFFLYDVAVDEEETIDEVKTSIEALEGELASRKAQLAKLEAAAAEEVKAVEAAKVAEGQAEDLEAQADALLKKAAALRATKAGK
jgi:hypothetical protein